jgi:hypothetical protein
VKLAHLLVELRQRCVGHKTRPVIHDFHQWLGTNSSLRSLSVKAGFAGPVLEAFVNAAMSSGEISFRCLGFVMLDEAPYWQSLFRVGAYSKVQVPRPIRKRKQALGLPSLFLKAHRSTSDSY